MANNKSPGDKDKFLNRGNEVSNKLLCDLKSISQDSSFNQLINCLDFVRSNLKITQDSILKEYIAFRDKSIGASPDMLILTSFYYLWSYENLVRSVTKVSSSDNSSNDTSHTSKNTYMAPTNHNTNTNTNTTDLQKRSKSIFKNSDTNMNQSYLSRHETPHKPVYSPIKVSKPITKEDVSKGVGDILFGNSNTNTSMISVTSSIRKERYKEKEEEPKSFLKQKRGKDEDHKEVINPPEKKRKFENVELESSKENLNITNYLKSEKKINKEKSENKLVI